jgi:hypothetical protein
MPTFKTVGKAVMAMAAVMLLAAPAMAGKGYGPGDGTGTRSQPRDGSGRGPGDCSTPLNQPAAPVLFAGKAAQTGSQDGSANRTRSKDSSCKG